MVLASLVHYSARLKCGIDMVGISNFVTFLENTADYRRDLRRLKYGIPFTLLSLTVHSITHSIVFLVANTLYVELYSFHQRSPLPLLCPCLNSIPITCFSAALMLWNAQGTNDSQTCGRS